jgi:hypothetical protein
MSRPHISIDDALHEYYKLKDLYDEKYEIKKSSVLSDETLSIAQKRSEIAKFKRARKCIVCKATGGTKFTDLNRTLKAVCGSATNPCGLNIEIAKGKIVNIGELMAATYSKIEGIKDNIIKYKLDLLFRYITDEQLVQKFGEAKKDLDTYLEQYDKLYNKYIDITVNPQNIEELKRFNSELYMYIGQIKQLMNEFKATGENEKIRTVIEIYLTNIVPLTKKIRDATYVYNSIEYDDNTKEYKLIQKKYNIKSMEVDIEHPQVISFTK